MSARLAFRRRYLRPRVLSSHMAARVPSIQAMKEAVASGVSFEEAQARIAQRRARWADFFFASSEVKPESGDRRAERRAV